MGAQIANTKIGREALCDKALYNAVIEHRKRFVGLSNFDYATLQPQSLQIVPPDDVLPLWRNDYVKMQQNMIYGVSPSFDQMIHRISELNNEINHIIW